MYAVRILKAASRELERLDKPVARRILERIHWLAENIEHIKPLPLKGALSSLYKLREGDYRILYEIIRSEKVIHRPSPGDLRRPITPILAHR